VRSICHSLSAASGASTGYLRRGEANGPAGSMQSEEWLPSDPILQVEEIVRGILVIMVAVTFAVPPEPARCR
jgi:hypothetical protein